MNFKQDHFKYLQKTDKGFILQRFLNGISKISVNRSKKNRKLYYSRGFTEGTFVHPLKFEDRKLNGSQETTRHYLQEKKLGQLNITGSLNDFQFPKRVDCFLSPLENCKMKQVFLDDNSENIQKWQNLDENSRQTRGIYQDYFSSLTLAANFLENRKEPLDENLRTPSLFSFNKNIKEYIQQTAQTYKSQEKRIEIISNIIQKITESGRFLKVNTLQIKTRFRFNSKLTYSYILLKDYEASKSSNYKSNEFMVDDSSDEMTKDKSLIGLEKKKCCKYLSTSKESPDLDIRRYHMKMVISDICSKAININCIDII